MKCTISTENLILGLKAVLSKIIIDRKYTQNSFVEAYNSFYKITTNDTDFLVQGTLSKFLNPNLITSFPSVARLNMFCEVLGISLSELLLMASHYKDYNEHINVPVSNDFLNNIQKSLLNRTSKSTYFDKTYYIYFPISDVSIESVNTKLQDGKITFSPISSSSASLNVVLTLPTISDDKKFSGIFNTSNNITKNLHIQLMNENDSFSLSLYYPQITPGSSYKGGLGLAITSLSGVNKVPSGFRVFISEKEINIREDQSAHDCIYHLLMLNQASFLISKPDFDNCLESFSSDLSSLIKKNCESETNYFLLNYENLLPKSNHRSHFPNIPRNEITAAIRDLRSHAISNEYLNISDLDNEFAFKLLSYLNGSSSRE